MMDSLRDRQTRHRRLDEALVHVFSARDLAGALFDEPEFERNRHTGITLLKTAELRVVLVVAAAGVALARHVVHGPATLHLVEGELAIDTDEGCFSAGPGDLVVLPRDEGREIVSRKRSIFLLVLSPES